MMETWGSLRQEAGVAPLVAPAPAVVVLARSTLAAAARTIPVAAMVAAAAKWACSEERQG